MQLGVLDKFITSGYVSPSLLQDFFTKTGDHFWTRRFEPGLSGSLVESNWRFEIPETVHKLLHGHTQKLEQLVYDRDVAFDKYASKKIAARPSDFHYGFQGSSLLTMQVAKEVGKQAICELATAHVTEVDKILREEARLHPEWAPTITNLKFPVAYEKRLREEPFVADHVVVASDFSRQSLLNAGLDQSKISTIPLGFELDHVSYTEKSFDNWNERPLKVLFAGTVTQRKGFKYLLDAIKRFSKTDVELHVIGNAYKELDVFKKEVHNFHYHGSMAQNELFVKYQEYDLLILPTVFEGFAMVIVEAMAAGLPVITTPHSIGPDVIEESNNSGIIVPIRDVDALVSAIHHFKNLDQDQMRKASTSARSASQRFTWDTHRDSLNQFLREKLSEGGLV
ncbi:glycosyltransferase family 4 protein [Halocola ammonii]